MTTETAEKHEHDNEKGQHQSQRINIRINGTHYRVDSERLTGVALCALASIPAGNQLFLEVHGEDNDRPIAPDETVELHSGMQFYDVPVGNLG